MDGNELKAGAMDPRQFARRVVDNALKSTPDARLWYGTASGLIWFMTSFFKHTFLVCHIPGLASFHSRVRWKY